MPRSQLNPLKGVCFAATGLREVEKGMGWDWTRIINPIEELSFCAAALQLKKSLTGLTILKW